MAATLRLQADVRLNPGYLKNPRMRLRFCPAQEIEVEILQRRVKWEVRPGSLWQIQIGFQVRWGVQSVF